MVNEVLISTVEPKELFHSPDEGRYIRMHLLAPTTASWFWFSVGPLGLPLSHSIADSDILGHLQYHLIPMLSQLNQALH